MISHQDLDSGRGITADYTPSIWAGRCLLIIMCVFVNPFKPEFTIVIFIRYKAANCSRNSRLVVDKHALKWDANEKNILLFLKQLHAKCRSETPGFRDAK